MNIKNVTCKNCLMDTTASDIVFDEDGICNFCKDFKKIIFKNNHQDNSSFKDLIERIKKDGINKEYDCVVGLSGGIDSSWTLVKVVKLGLRPLCVHMDNGWNSELAQNNIERLVRTLNVDLYTHVIDWNEYRLLMQSFFDANVIDVELLYDNAMLAVNYQQANMYGIKYILAGTNKATEGIKMPYNWNWLKFDKKNIVNIAKINGVSLNTFPAIGSYQYLYYRFIKNIKWLSFLDFFNYDKFEAINTLKTEFNFKPYPYKHYESIFTRFYQGYILPKKFNVDKRKIHLSALVLTGLLDLQTAKNQLKDLPYNSDLDLKNDKEYFLKKMNWNIKDLNTYLSSPGVCHSFYKNERQLWEKLSKIQNLLKNLKTNFF